MRKNLKKHLKNKRGKNTMRKTKIQMGTPNATSEDILGVRDKPLRRKKKTLRDLPEPHQKEYSKRSSARISDRNLW